MCMGGGSPKTPEPPPIPSAPPGIAEIVIDKSGEGDTRGSKKRAGKKKFRIDKSSPTGLNI